jgi:hypothetical protein
MDKDLETTITKLETQLDDGGETVENLSKAVVNMSDTLKKSVGKKGKKGVVESKDNSKTPAETTTTTTTTDLLKSLLDDNDEPPTKTASLGKTFNIDEGTTAVDVSEFILGLQHSLDTFQATLAKGMLPKKMLKKALAIVVDAQLDAMHEELDLLKKGMGVVCAAMGKVLEHMETVETAPARGSQFDRMEKSIAVAKAGLLAEGGTPFPMNKRNMETLAKAKLMRLVDEEQFQIIKKTQVIPPGISLVAN